MVILLVKLVQLNDLARMISIGVLALKLFGSLSITGWPGALVISAVHAVAIVYLLRTWFSRAALEYREWRLEELRARTAKRFMKKERLR